MKCIFKLIESFKNKFMLIFFCLTCSFISCANENSFPDSQNELKIAQWNVQTFFDSTTTGNEYKEFTKTKYWSRENYIVRLQRLAEVIKQIDADVFIMEEIENKGVLFDINNFLAGQWNLKKSYKYGAFAKAPKSSIGIGIISRYPLSQLKIHSLGIFTEKTEMPLMRPLVEINVNKNSSQLTLLLNHWKSKSGKSDEEEESQIWRNYQEDLLAYKINSLLKENKNILCAGDFNKNLIEFTHSSSKENGIIILAPFSQYSAEVKNLWYQDDILIEPGSYYFNDQWERIDHFFTAGNFIAQQFKVETEGPWCDSQTKIPEGYTVWTNKGYSDHLPLSCIVRF